MTADFLIFKKRHGKKERVKITKRMKAGYAPACNIEVNLKDYKDVALFLHDLKFLYNVQIDKAIKEYQKGKGWLWQ
jgi:hypothetical protein